MQQQQQKDLAYQAFHQPAGHVCRLLVIVDRINCCLSTNTQNGEQGGLCSEASPQLSAQKPDGSKAYSDTAHSDVCLQKNPT